MLLSSSHQRLWCVGTSSRICYNPLHHFRRHRTASMPTQYWTHPLATTPRRQPASPHWPAPTCGPATSCLRWSQRSKLWAPLLCTLGCCWPATATSTAPPRLATCRGCTTSWMPRAATRVGGVGWLGGGGAVAWRGAWKHAGALLSEECPALCERQNGMAVASMWRCHGC